MPIANNDPYFGALPPPDQDPRMVAQNQQAGGSKPQANVMDDILQRMITQNLGQAPPPERPLNNWEIFAGLMHPELMNVLMARKQDTPEMQKYQAAQKVMPSLLTAYSAGEGRRDTEARFQQTQQRLQGQQAFRQNLQSQLKPDTRVEYDPGTGYNRYHTYYRDPLRNNQIVDEQWTDYAPIQSTPYTGPSGNIDLMPTSPTGQLPGQPAPIGPPQGATPPDKTGVGHAAGGAGLGVAGGSPTPDNMKPAGPGGKLHLRQAPPQLTDQAIRQGKFLGGLQGVFSAYDQAHQAQTARFGQGAIGMVGQMAQDKMAQDKYGRAFVQEFGDPEVQQYYNKIRLALYDYVKAQTGAQFSITEMDRYLASFPTTMDDPETAHTLITLHAQRAVQEINTLKLNWKSIQVGNQRIYVDPKYLDEFLRTGGQGQSTGQPEEDDAMRILNEVKQGVAAKR